MVGDWRAYHEMGNLVTIEGGSEKGKTRNPSQDRELSRDDDWRWRRGDLRTLDASTALDFRKFLAECRAWCISEETRRLSKQLVGRLS